ncbi:MAG TPA: lipoprotein [Amaricoccus sp.]|nr:lipoprotein [Amaricoccus sp.]
MSGFWPRVGFCLLLAALAACGIKGDPAPPEPELPADAS